MMLNSKKCKLMTVTRSRNPPKPIYNIGSQILQNVDNYRYLGLIISRDLSWKQHINGIASKATRLNGFLGRVIKSRNTKILTTLYCSISRPLEYAAPVWCPALSTQQDILERVQRRFTRFCLGLPRRALFNSDREMCYTDRCFQLGLPLLNNRIHFLAILFVVKCLHNKFDLPIDNVVVVNPVKFQHQRARTNAAHHSLFNRFPRLWDALPSEVKDAIVFSLSTFTKLLRDHLLVPGSVVAMTEIK